MEKIRFYTQLAALFLSNCRLFITRANPIYSGVGKYICFPGLNCYSCPAAAMSCPLGALQNFMAGLRINLANGQPLFGIYVLGSLGIIASMLGRMPCAWLCPFGFLQDWLFRVRVPKMGFWRPLALGRYLFLILFVVVLPLALVDQAGFGSTWFCKYVCPAGTLEAGLPLLAIEPALRRLVGALFYFKLGLLVFFMLWSSVTLRPFCRAVCPLGLILGFFNRYSWLRLKFHGDRCVDCKACLRTCPVGVRFADGSDDINSSKCIRCLRCYNLCPGGAVTVRFSKFELLEANGERQTQGCDCNQK